MRVYHFLNRQYGLENIRRRRLKVATINALNDPFEMIAAASPNAHVRAALLKAKDEINRHTGLLCFSRDWHNSVQWAHYAEKHQGLCLGFDLPDALLVPVQYQPRRITIVPGVIQPDGSVAAMFIRDLVRTKSSHWRYENEVRRFVDFADCDTEGTLHFANFSDQLRLREVIVGHLSTVTRNELADALGDLAVTVRTKKARLAFRSFRVVTQRRKDMWR